MGSLTQLALQILSAPGGTLLLDATPYLEQCAFETGDHGFATLRARLRLSEATAWHLYRRGQPLHLRVCDGACTAWEGRAEDVGISQGEDGIASAITGFGYWNALGDVPYTALWSDSAYTNWWVVQSTEPGFGVGAAAPERFSISNQARLFIGLTKNTSYGAFAHQGRLRSTIPQGSSRVITTMTADYTLLAPTGWKLDLYGYDANATYLGGTAWTLTATGSLQTGTLTATFPASTATIVVALYTPTTMTSTGETGAQYAQLTNVRVKTTSAASVTADLIAADLINAVRALNPSQLSSSTALIGNPGIDLTDVIYEDQSPADILTTLAGDNRWETGVYDGQQVYFRPKGSVGRAWLVDLDSIELERTLDHVYNSAYAVYRDASGKTQRTAIASDSASVTQAGLTRRQAIRADTTSSAQATAIRNASLNDTKTPLPRATIQFRRVFTDLAAQAPLWMVRAGDRITIRNLPVTLGTAVDRIRSFRVSRTTYDMVAGTLTVEPEAPLPTLPILVAQEGGA